MENKPCSIAIIGAGVAGLTAGYLLSRKHNVTLFEKSGRLGGNAYTHTTSDGENVDIAVAAFGKVGYPLFYKLLDELGIKTKLCLTSYMSFENLQTGEGMYMTPTLKGLWSQKFKIISPRSIATVLKLFSGIGHGLQLFNENSLDNMTLREALARIPSIKAESRVIFLCALCLLSSMSAEEVLDAPADFFFHKLKIHNDVVSPKAVYSVRATSDRTKSYVDALAAPYKGNIELNSDIETVLRNKSGVELVFKDGSKRAFDKVIFACNADQAIDLLEQPTEQEDELLGAWSYKDGRMVVHSDHSAFPKRELMQAYTFMYTENEGVFNTSVSGALWLEPGVSKDCTLISSQHPNFDIDENLIELETVLRTPIFDFKSCATIEQLPHLNGKAHSYYCGSHFGHGLHEDAVRSAVDVAEMLGVEFRS